MGEGKVGVPGMGTEFRQTEDRHGVVVGGRGERVGGTGGMGMK